MPIDWGVHLLRLSVFSNAPLQATEKDWQKITGQEEAESRTSVPGGKRFAGKSEGGALLFGYAGERLDLILQPVEATEAPDPEGQLKLPLVGPWTDLRQKFLLMGTRSLKTVNAPIVRMAFGGVLLSKQESLEECYQQLQALLKSVAVDPKNMRDLLFRVNWQRDSKVTALKINRLTTWAAMRFATRLLHLSADKLSDAGPAGEQFAIRLEFDHNTDATNLKPFEAAEIEPIFEELVQAASENAELGERP